MGSFRFPRVFRLSQRSVNSFENVYLVHVRVSNSSTKYILTYVQLLIVDAKVVVIVAAEQDGARGNLRGRGQGQGAVRCVLLSCTVLHNAGLSCVALIRSSLRVEITSNIMNHAHHGQHHTPCSIYVPWSPTFTARISAVLRCKRCCTQAPCSRY